MDLLIRNDDSPKPGHSAVTILSLNLEDDSRFSISDNSVSYWVSSDRLNLHWMVVMKDTDEGKKLTSLVKDYLGGLTEHQQLVDHVETLALRHMSVFQIRNAMKKACVEAHRKGRHEVQAKLREVQAKLRETLGLEP